MTGRKAIFGLCMLAAMALSAIVVQGASAAFGQTAFTCVSTAISLDFRTDHCVPGETGTAFGHEAITEETHAKFSNEKTDEDTEGAEELILKETLAGTNVEIEATGVEGHGTLRNVLVAGEMRAIAEVNPNVITFTGVAVRAPAKKGCKVFEDIEVTKTKGAEGVVKSKPLKGHTTVIKDKENGVEEERHSVILEPVAAPTLATFFLECEPGSGVPREVEGTWAITGTFTCPTHGATIACNHSTVTEQNTLKGKGARAGLAGKATITAGKLPTPQEQMEGKTPPTSPISVTTE